MQRKEREKVKKCKVNANKFCKIRENQAKNNKENAIQFEKINENQAKNNKQIPF